MREVFTSGFTDLRTAQHWSSILSEIRALQVAEGSGRHYYGVIGVQAGSPYCGLAHVPGRAAIGMDGQCGSSTAAHEWGHNFGRYHAPCGNPGGPDPNYPYGGASIGSYGLEVGRLELKAPTAYTDLMSYCDPAWISDYTYEGVLEYRDAAGAPEADGPRQDALVVWGRIEDGRLVLEPAFEATTVAALPESPGPYRIEGLDADGRALFALSFAGAPVDHMPDVRHFAFALPLEQARASQLDRIRLVAPGTALAPAEVWRRDLPTALAEVRATAEGPGRVRLEWDDDALSLVVVRNARSGEILSFARGRSAMLQTEADELDLVLATGVGGVERRVRVR